jgi:hypothetical protein
MCGGDQILHKIAAGTIQAVILPEFSNQHAMARPNQDSLEAVIELNSFVMRGLDFARDSSSGGETLTPSSLRAFGRAIHALADMGTPQHMTKDHTPIEWDGISSLPLHFWRERGPASSWGGIGMSMRLIAAGTFYSLYKLTNKKLPDFETFVRHQISDYVDRSFAGAGGRVVSTGAGSIAQESARQCALGNPAACSQ